MARLNRWWPDLFDGLGVAYDDPVAVGARVVELAARSFAARADELHALDLRRTLEPDWFQQPRAFGYAAYVDRFAGTLAGVGRRVGYLRHLGVTYLHLMPLLFPRAQPNDGGYAVVDYRRVRPDLGDTDDLRSLTTRLREEGISLCLDLVLNHVAREHEWARAARAGDPRYRAYFHIYPDRSAPDAFEASLPEVFPTFAPGSFTWDEDLRSWVWTTFNSYQWDVAWSNPDVFCEYADLIMWLANVGVEIVRLDAIAFIWKRLGTNCQNQPEVHALTQALRALTKIACPALIFKAEAIVGPRDLAGYLGTGERYGKVSDLAYHNNLMVQIWSMLASRDVRLAAQALQAIPQLPPNTAWVTYVRCHDDIGWAIDDADAAAVGLTGPGHRRFLSDFYSGSFPGSFARGLVFQSNNATGGSAARWRAWPGWRRPSRMAMRTQWPPPLRGFCSYTLSSSAGAVCRCCGWATSSGCSTTRTGRTNPSTPKTPAGCTGHVCRGGSPTDSPARRRGTGRGVLPLGRPIRRLLGCIGGCVA